MRSPPPSKMKNIIAVLCCQLFDKVFSPLFVFTRQVCEEPNALSLASVDPATGSPSVRVVLLKGYDDRGFTFYTNYARCEVVV